MMKALVFGLICSTSSCATAFQTESSISNNLSKNRMKTHSNRISDLATNSDVMRRRSTGGVKTPPLSMSSNNENESSLSFLDRFVNPKIDDRFLPLNDAAVVQIVGPSLQLFTYKLVNNASTLPSWCKPIYDNTLWEYRGSFLAPALIHGAGLAFCWLCGALAAQAYERKALDPTYKIQEGGKNSDVQNGNEVDYSTVIWTLVKAGSFASGLLIVATQFDLLQEFGGRYVQLGDDPQTDIRLLTAADEIIKDIFFSIIAIVPQRLFLAYSIQRGGWRGPVE